MAEWRAWTCCIRAELRGRDLGVQALIDTPAFVSTMRFAWNDPNLHRDSIAYLSTLPSMAICTSICPYDSSGPSRSVYTSKTSLAIAAAQQS